jgi:hypothetical protein
MTRKQTHIDDAVTNLIFARLSMPDLADLLPEEDGAAKELVDDLAALQSRLKIIAEDYDAGHIDGRRYAIATEKINAQIVTTQAALARLTAHDAGILRADNPAQAFAEAPLMLKRAAINALCEVRLQPAPRGSKTFDADSVVIDWRAVSRPAPAAVRL